jgi:hypothetical protein
MGHAVISRTVYEAMAAVEAAGVPRGRPGPECRVTLNDLAAGGVSVTVDEPVTAGEQFFLRLPGRDGRPPLALLCAARNCRSTAEEFHVGAAFLACGEGSIAEVCRRLPEAA